MWEYDGAYRESDEHQELIEDFATALYQCQTVQLSNDPHGHVVMRVWIPDEEWVIQAAENMADDPNDVEIIEDYDDLPELLIQR